MSNRIDVLVVEPDSGSAREIAEALSGRFATKVVETLTEAETHISAAPPRLLICSDDLPGEAGLMFLARTRDEWPGMRRILMAADLDGMLFFHAMHEVSLFSYLSKPVDRAELLRKVHHALFEESMVFGSMPIAAVEVPTDFSWKNGLAIAAGVAVGTLALFALAAALYEVKSLAGIDIFPNWHLRDLLGR